jgi:hypothetical protein
MALLIHFQTIGYFTITIIVCDKCENRILKSEITDD